MRTYYYEHSTDESRYLRSSNAREIASVAHAQPDSEIGVIIDTPDGLDIRVVARQSTVRDTAATLAAA